jgi:peptidoglycan/LPS O-acetylase OafA/YrhL
MRRLILSVLAGYLIINTVTVASFIGLNATGVNLNSPGWLSAKLLISLAGGALGGYATARLAQAGSGKAVLALAVLMTALSIIAIVIMFGTEPLWFQAALVLGAGVAVWAGGRSRQRSF